MAVLLIDPAEKLNYTFDWADELGDGITISTSSWAISPTGPTLSGSANSPNTATIYIQSCTAGAIYRLVNTITTSAGTTEQRAMILRCEDF